MRLFSGGFVKKPARLSQLDLATRQPSKDTGHLSKDGLQWSNHLRAVRHVSDLQPNCLGHLDSLCRSIRLLCNLFGYRTRNENLPPFPLQQLQPIQVTEKNKR
jgi:hypothetical protein